MEELRRRMSSARRGGSRPSWSRPDHVVERIPSWRRTRFLGAFWTPSVGVVDSLARGHLMREAAQEPGG